MATSPPFPVGTIDASGTYSHVCSWRRSCLRAKPVDPGTATRLDSRCIGAFATFPILALKPGLGISINCLTPKFTVRGGTLEPRVFCKDPDREYI